MATINVGQQTITSSGFTSTSVVVPDGLTDVVIKMTACPEWVPATGGTFAMGVESSVDGGSSWHWVTETGFIGTPWDIGQPVFRGSFPAVAATVGNLVGARLRARAKTSGPTIHPTFQIVTTP